MILQKHHVPLGFRKRRNCSCRKGKATILYGKDLPHLDQAKNDESSLFRGEPEEVLKENKKEVAAKQQKEARVEENIRIMAKQLCYDDLFSVDEVIPT
ncbi:hypothetical protein H5410_005794 [Solanum commersonii]|uniref:Uncharacterized protein n=1 Tax=Solanum commersonii TaxID=4109 RepID=A0A9J6A846_SOLCO|nr:hypothetical protein H5410_005794 [Solanum commersonii]